MRRQAVPSERGMTEVGLARARDLANGRPVSEETIRRMLSYFQRHEVDKEGETWEEQGKGWQAWHGWGGDAGFRWARVTVAQLDAKKGDAEKTGASTLRKAIGENHWEQAQPRGDRERQAWRHRDQQRDRGRAREEERRAQRGARATTQRRGPTSEPLKAVFRRGAGAFSTSHRPGMTRNQWALGRVNAFLYLLRNGRPERASYTTDDDLLPEEHAKASKEDN